MVSDGKYIILQTAAVLTSKMIIIVIHTIMANCYEKQQKSDDGLIFSWHVVINAKNKSQFSKMIQSVPTIFLNSILFTPSTNLTRHVLEDT